MWTGKLRRRADHIPAVASLRVVPPEDGLARIELRGRLDIDSVAAVWPQARAVLQRFSATPVVIDASRLEHCDGAGIALLFDLLREPRPQGAEVRVEGLAPEFRMLLDEFDPERFRLTEPSAPVPIPLTEYVGRKAAGVGRDLYDALAFVGEVSAALGRVVARPDTVRWNDAVLAGQRVGVEALPIVSLIAFLMGLILAFQAAIAMRQFGAEVLVADLVGISLLRELGPLMTAILLAGRSGAAFAAEIGTMRVNEEVDALTTMGLDPIRFLVVPRVLAALAMTPLLTLYADLVGLIGGATVMSTFEIPLKAYMRETFAFVGLSDFLGGMAKSFVFGLIIAGVGCRRGLQTGTGAAAVGLSATSAVVTSLVLVVVADGIFAVIYYYLDI